MNAYQTPQGPQLLRLRALFAEREQVQVMMRAHECGTKPKRIAASALYASAKCGAPHAALADSRGARQFYHQALAETAQYVMPEAKAASSYHMLERHGEGCRIRVEPSRAEPDQFFVIVEMPREATRARMPTSLVLRDAQDFCQWFTLPPVRDGIAQFIAEANSDLVCLIGDPTTRIYLT